MSEIIIHKESELLARYIENKDKQNLKLSTGAINILIQNVRYDNELFKVLLDEKNVLGLDEKQITSMRKIKDDVLDITVDNVLVLLKDKVMDTKEFDLSYYEDKQDLFQQKFKEALTSISGKDEDINKKFLVFLSKFKNAELMKLLTILEPINKDVFNIVQDNLKKRTVVDIKSVVGEVRNDVSDIDNKIDIQIFRK